MRFKVSLPIGFGPDSKLLRAQHAKFLQTIVEQVLSPGASAVYAIMKPMRLSPDVFSEMIGELSAVVDRFAYLSENPKANRGDDGEDFKLAIAAGPAKDQEEAPTVVELTEP